MALAPIEPLAKSSLDRAHCGAPGAARPEAGEDNRPTKLCRQAENPGFQPLFQATSWHLSAGSPGGLGITGPRNGGGYGVPSIRWGGALRVNVPALITSGWHNVWLAPPPDFPPATVALLAALAFPYPEHTYPLPDCPPPFEAGRSSCSRSHWTYRNYKLTPIFLCRDRR